jgi:enoyl-CoA hydratase/carnithine racemase
MFMPAAKLGLHYYPNGLRRWVARLGLGAAKRLFLTGGQIDDQEMLRIGFLDALAENGQLDTLVDRWITDLLAPACASQRTMKAALNEASRGEFDASTAYRAFDRSLHGPDVAEALSAFREKRPPSFS